jgi:DNA (cytosine-5)-methyltransferase 1
LTFSATVLYWEKVAQKGFQVASRLIAIDLFCGSGGLTTGLKKAGFKIIGAVDIEPLAIETYKMNHRVQAVWQQNIQNVSVDEVLSKLALEPGDLDLLAGCPPCEGFSDLRTHNGAKRINDSRNDLIFEFMRFVRGLKPKTIMLENVPRLMSDKRMSKVKAELDALGYQYVVNVLDASDFGVPQRRKRMILLGTLVGSVNFANPIKQVKTVRDTIHELGKPKLKPGPGEDKLHISNSKRSERIQNLIRAIPKDGGGRMDLGEGAQLPCHRRCDGFKDIYGRMSWDEVSPTITGGCINPSKGRFLHPTQNRAITLREAALLQSFPAKYKFSLKNGSYAAASLIGDALPPDFIWRHAKQLVSVLRTST